MEGSIYLRNGKIWHSRLSLDVDYFKTIDAPDKAYWLGFICADGNIKKTNNKMTLVSKDLEVIQGFKEATNSGHAITTNTKPDKRTGKVYTNHMIQVGNAPFVENLINQGITSNKSDVLLFPNIEEKYYSYFIAGLFDGDGCVYLRNKNKTCLAISLISTKEILSFIKRYLLKTYQIKGIVDDKVSINKDNVWKMHLYKDAQKFLDFIYQDDFFPYYLKRKYDIYKKYSA